MPITFPQEPGNIAYLIPGYPDLTTIGATIKQSCQGKAEQLTPTQHPPTLKPMEVQLAPDLQAKLTHMAEQQGRDQAALITEAVERLVNYETRFSSETENDPYWKQEEQLVASGAMTLPQEEMDWERFFSHPQTATISTEAAVQAVIDSRGDR